MGGNTNRRDPQASVIIGFRTSRDASLERGPMTAVALANKLARIVYALSIKGGHYDDRPVAA